MPRPCNARRKARRGPHGHGSCSSGIKPRHQRSPPVNALFLGTGAMAFVASLSLPACADEPPTGYSPPHVVDYTGGRLPEYAHLEQRTNMKLITPGLWVAGVSYGVSVLYALGTCGAQTECRSGSQWLYVPIVGPFITAALAPTS